MELYKKLQKARHLIKESKLTKSGRNSFSKYDYYTPEQVDKLVNDACKEVNILTLFNLERNEFGYYGELTIVDLDSTKDVIIFNQSTDIPSIKATNVTQQIGGAVTYTNRYMLMTAFNIVDNSLDFDADQKPEKQNNKKWLNVYKKGTKDLTDEMTSIYAKMRSKEIKDISSIKNEFNISKEDESIINGWFKLL